jgi:hypothetical protein
VTAREEVVAPEAVMFAKVFVPVKELLSESRVVLAPLDDIQVLLMAKQPVDRLIPPPKVEVAAPVTARVVVVALVEVALSTVNPPVIVEEAFEMKPWRVGTREKTAFPPVPVSSVRRFDSSVDVSIEVEEILLLKIDQSVEESLPLAAALANGRLKV